MENQKTVQIRLQWLLEKAADNNGIASWPTFPTRALNLSWLKSSIGT